MDISDMKTEIKKKKGMSNLDPEIWNYCRRPIGEAMFEHYDKENKDEKVDKTTMKYKHWSDIVKCATCGREYKRSNVSNHKKTKIHQAYEQINKKLNKFILDK